MRPLLTATTATNKEPEDHVWLIYGGQTYHVPLSYVHRHPRGMQLILPYANQDMTAAFDSAGHSKGALRTLRRYTSDAMSVEDIQKVHAAEREARSQVVWNWCVRAGSLLSVAVVLGAVYARCQRQTQ